MKWIVSVLLVCLLLALPFQLKEGKPSHRQAHAFMGKLVLKAVKFETKLILKNWLKGVAKKEGKRVALSALKSLKALPMDANFRLAVVAALAGGNYAQAIGMTGQRAGQLATAGARNQWEADKKRLSDHPEIAFQSFGQSAGDTVEDQWNHANDKVTCGQNNKDIELKAVDSLAPHEKQHYTITNKPNDKLLTGRALLQRTLFEGMMRNSSFQNAQQAQKTANLYSRLACLGGKSRKVIAFMGGMALHGKKNVTQLENIRAKTFQFMSKVDQWAQKKL
ncbi:MAG: hypothetical protein Q9M28_09915 [Mariprofundaceae bacterium]|nr:hypothetical protein [Mariprofundaceae bacterium]